MGCNGAVGISTNMWRVMEALVGDEIGSDRESLEAVVGEEDEGWSSGGGQGQREGVWRCSGSEVKRRLGEEGRSSGLGFVGAWRWVDGGQAGQGFSWWSAGVGWIWKRRWLMRRGWRLFGVVVDGVTGDERLVRWVWARIRAEALEEEAEM